YNQYEPLPGIHINGNLTLGENLADLIGLRIAHRAYEIAHGKSPEANLGSYTPHQQLLMNYGKIWKGKCTDGYLVRQLATDPHAPSPYRVKEVSNLDEYHDAFGVQEGDAMYKAPEDRVRVWFGK